MFGAFCICFFSREMLFRGEKMKEQKQVNPELRVDPENRLCEKFDATSIAKFDVAKPGKMGMRVLDDCAEEHIM